MTHPDRTAFSLQQITRFLEGKSVGLLNVQIAPNQDGPTNHFAATASLETGRNPTADFIRLQQKMSGAIKPNGERLVSAAGPREIQIFGDGTFGLTHGKTHVRLTVNSVGQPVPTTNVQRLSTPSNAAVPA